MNIIKKVMLFVKNIFIKQDKVKKIADSENVIRQNNKKQNFRKLLKTDITEKKEEKEVEILTCVGDGLGIQKKMSA